MELSVLSNRLNKAVDQLDSVRHANEVIVPQKEKKGVSKGAQVAVGAGLAALAVVGIYIASKGRVKANLQQKLQRALNNVCEFGDDINDKFIKKQIENIQKLPVEEQIPALENLSRYRFSAINLKRFDLGNKENLAKELSSLRPNRRGVAASDKVMALMNEGKYVEAAKLFDDETLKLSNFYKPGKTKGTVQETITTVLGKDSKIKPHTYDLAQEADEFLVYQNSGGYHDRFINKKGARWEDFDIDDISRNLSTCVQAGNDTFFQTAKNFHLGNGVSVLHGVRNGKYVTVLRMPDFRSVDTSISLAFSSKTNKMTQLQKDLISLGNNPEKFNKNILDKITELGSGGMIENCDYDLMLSVIQSMARA